MNLSMTTDYVTSVGDPVPYLRRIAAADFSHVHWCHEWNTDHLYGSAEIESLRRELSSLGLRLLDLHGSGGLDCNWGARQEDARRRGVELVENRMEMTAHLGSQTMVLHLPDRPPGVRAETEYWDTLFRSLDEMEALSRRLEVRIAIENMPGDTFADIKRLFARYGPSFLGLCYDSGHGNIGGDGLGHLERHKDRLIAVHLHDNDGTLDEHNFPFTGTVDWGRLARILRESSYRGCISLESNLRGMDVDGDVYLAEAYRAAKRLGRMVVGEFV